MPNVYNVSGSPQEPIQVQSPQGLQDATGLLFASFQPGSFQGDPKQLASVTQDILKGLDPYKQSLEYIEKVTNIMANLATVYSAIYDNLNTIQFAGIRQELACMNELTKKMGFSREYSHQQHLDHAQWVAALSSNIMKALFVVAEQNSFQPVPGTIPDTETRFTCAQFIKSDDPRFQKLGCSNDFPGGG